MQELAKGAQVAALEALPDLGGHIFDAMEGGDHFGLPGAAALALFGEDFGGLARVAGEEEHQIALQLRLDAGGQVQGLHPHAIGFELDPVQAAKSGGVLILLADGRAQLFDLDGAGGFGQFRPAQVEVQGGGDGFDEGHRHRAGGA